MDKNADGPAIEVKDLTRDFGKFRAVDHVSFSVARGEIFGFLGPNGAGKSTTIRMLNGLLLPTSGEGWVDGLHIVRDHDRIKARIGYMSQRFSLYEDPTAEENLTFFGGVYGLPPPRLKERLEEVLTLVDLAPRRRDLTRDLAAYLVAKVRYEQKAEVTTDTFPGKRYPAWVSYIAAKAEFTPKSVETFKERVTLVYRTKIRVENPHHELKPGMPAEAVIFLNQPPKSRG